MRLCIIIDPFLQIMLYKWIVRIVVRIIAQNKDGWMIPIESKHGN